MINSESRLECCRTEHTSAVRRVAFPSSEYSTSDLSLVIRIFGLGSKLIAVMTVICDVRAGVELVVRGIEAAKPWAEGCVAHGDILLTCSKKAELHMIKYVS